MNILPIHKISYEISIYASAYQKLVEFANFNNESLIIVSFAVCDKKHIFISDFFVASQTKYYSTLKLDEVEFLSEYQLEEDNKDKGTEIVPVVIYKYSKSGAYCDVRSLKNFLKQSFTLFMFAEYNKDIEFTIYDYDGNLKYEGVSAIIDTSEFEYGKEYVRIAYKDRFKITYSTAYPKYSGDYGYDGYDGYDSYSSRTISSSTVSRLERKEDKDAPINTDNPTISSIVSENTKEINRDGFQYLLNATQSNLIKYLPKALEEFYDASKITTTFDYIYCRGSYPILLVCHLDTKHTELPSKIFCDEKAKIMWSPQGIGGDDRCGVYAALSVCKLIHKEKKMPYILFTTDEEIGCYGAKQAAIDLEKDKGIFKYLLEMDRHGKDEVVYYSTENKKFEEYVQSFGFVKNNGFSSDIVHLTSKWGTASCNISIGYYNEHTLKEYIHTAHLMESIGKVVRMVTCSEQASYYEKK